MAGKASKVMQRRRRKTRRRTVGRKAARVGLSRVHFSSKKTSWCTPPDIVALVRRVAGPFGVGLDPCSNARSVVGARVEWRRRQNGLKRSWSGFGLAYVNSPYGKRHNPQWAKKIAEEASQGVEIIALLAVRSSEKWFQYLWGATCFCFVDHRIHFIGAKSGAPFGSVAVYFGRRVFAFVEAFKDLGTIVFPGETKRVIELLRRSDERDRLDLEEEYRRDEALAAAYAAGELQDTSSPPDPWAYTDANRPADVPDVTRGL